MKNRITIRAIFRGVALLHSSFTFPTLDPSYSQHYHNTIGRYVTGKTYRRGSFWFPDPSRGLIYPALKRMRISPDFGRQTVGTRRCTLAAKGASKNR